MSGGKATAKFAFDIGLANQIKAETVVDHPALDQGISQDHGGFARLNKIFDGQVETILGDFHARIWQDAA